MMPDLLAPIRPYITGAVVVVIAGLSLGMAVQTWRLDHAKADLKSARAALKDPETKQTWQAVAEQCKANAQTLSDSLDRQNAAVLAWQQAGQQASQAATAAVRAAGVAQNAAQAQAGAILAARPGDDRCASALELIRGG